MPGYCLRLNSLLIHAAILVAISLPYCVNLGKSSIWDANEAFYAETPREMLITGDYLAPRFNFQPRVQKPPLTYWAILISYKLFGINEFAVRLPGALAAIGVLLFSYGTARLLFSSRAALIAAIITATTARIFILARRLPIDILLLFFLTGTLFFLVRATQKKEALSWALAYLCASLGFLTKGPIAVIIPVCAYLGWTLWSRRLKTIEPHLLLGASIFVLVTLPWYVLIYRAHGLTYISPFFLRDNLGRFATESMGPSRGAFYYFSVYAIDFFPWSLLALVSVGLLWISRRKERFLKSLSFGLPLIWCAFIFLLFSLSKNKQEYYIAPIYPAAAIIMSGVLDKTIKKETLKRHLEESFSAEHRPLEVMPEPILSQRPFLWAWSYGLLTFLLVLISLLMPYVFRSFMPGIPLVLHYSPTLVLIAGAMLLAGNIIRGKPAHCFSSRAISMWSIFLMGALLYLPALETFRPVKNFCELIEAQSLGDAEAGFFRTALPSMAYYLRRPIFQESDYERMMSRFLSGRRIFCVLTERDYGYFANGNVTPHILDRHSRFSLRFGALFNEDYFPEGELLLVSNKPGSDANSSGGRPTL